MNVDEVIYESRRRFTVERWEPAGTGLLLRSDLAGGGRIDLRFTGVRVVSIAAELDGLRLAVARGELLGDVAAVLGRPREAGELLYTVRSQASAGWVLATGVHGLARSPDDDTDLRVEPRAGAPRDVVHHPA